VQSSVSSVADNSRVGQHIGNSIDNCFDLSGGLHNFNCRHMSYSSHSSIEKKLRVGFRLSLCLNSSQQGNHQQKLHLVLAL